MPPAATLTSMQVCPMVTGIIPHVGGPITGPGAPTVLLEGLPASVMGDLCVCVGPPSTIILGYPTVLCEGRPITVVGMSMTDHGGDVIGPGAVTVLIG
jgi:uncharacterized Zn-binding protein involved in type VI secretion